MNTLFNVLFIPCLQSNFALQKSNSSLKSNIEMITILTLISIFFLLLVIYLINKIQLDRQKFHSKITILEDFIVQISQEQKAQNIQLKLSDDLKEKLQQINTTLAKEIYEVNFKLVEDLYPRK